MRFREVLGPLFFAGVALAGAVTATVLHAAPPPPECIFPPKIDDGFRLQGFRPKDVMPASVDVMKLHSRPKGRFKLYLDFDGHDLTQTGWKGYGLSASKPLFDINDTQHRMAIYAIWQLVAEKYAPFNIDVTTEEPAARSLAEINTSDDGTGLSVKTAYRVVIGTDVGYPNAAGLARVHSRRAVGNWPAFLQVNEWYSPEDIALIVTHESGHMFGLYHDGVGDEPYFSGYPTWGPIMGAPTNSTMTQWSRGEYPNASNREDDLKILSLLGLAVDDFGDTIETAGGMQKVGDAQANGVVTLRQTGMIGTSADRDFLRFRAKAGRLDAWIYPVDALGNRLLGADLGSLDPRIVVVDSQGRTVSTIGKVINANLESDGDYFLSVHGAAPTEAGTNHSAYGSLGRYAVKLDVAQPADADLRPASPGPIEVHMMCPSGIDQKIDITFSQVAGATSYVVEVSRNHHEWKKVYESNVPPQSPFGRFSTGYTLGMRAYAVNQSGSSERSPVSEIHCEPY